MSDLDLEYIEYLVEKASRTTDSPMIVQWLPYVIQLVAEVKRLRENEKKLFTPRSTVKRIAEIKGTPWTDYAERRTSDE